MTDFLLRFVHSLEYEVVGGSENEGGDTEAQGHHEDGVAEVSGPVGEAHALGSLEVVRAPAE